MLYNILKMSEMGMLSNLLSFNFFGLHLGYSFIRYVNKKNVNYKITKSISKVKSLDPSLSVLYSDGPEYKISHLTCYF